MNEINMENQWAFFNAMSLTEGAKNPKYRSPKYDAKRCGDSYLLEYSGDTCTEILDSTLKRMMIKYTACGYMGSSQSCYRKSAHGWQGHLWDIAVMRMTYNYLLHEGFTSAIAIEIIREHIYQSIYHAKSTGRPAGKKGESVGDGRKANGIRKKFMLGKQKREWIEIGLSKQVSTLIDLMSAYRKSKNNRNWSWSRQKVLTFMSRINVHPDYIHLHPSNFFYSDI